MKWLDNRRRKRELARQIYQEYKHKLPKYNHINGEKIDWDDAKLHAIPPFDKKTGVPSTWGLLVWSSWGHHYIFNPKDLTLIYVKDRSNQEGYQPNKMKLELLE